MATEKPARKKVKEKHASEIVIPLVRPYKQLALAVLFFGICAGVLGHVALTNDRGVIINGIIHLGPDGADIFYAVLTVLSVGFVAMGGFSIHRISRIEPFQLVLGARSLSLPSGAVARAVQTKISLRDIVYVERLPPDAPKRLVIHARTGAVALPANYLPSGWTLQEIGDHIMDRARKENQRAQASSE